MQNIDTKNLDKATLEFASHIAWQFEFLCKNTKEGRAKAFAYGRVKEVLEHYTQKLDEQVEEETA